MLKILLNWLYVTRKELSHEKWADFGLTLTSERALSKAVWLSSDTPACNKTAFNKLVWFSL